MQRPPPKKKEEKREPLLLSKSLESTQASELACSFGEPLPL